MLRGDVTEPVAKLLSVLTGGMSSHQIRESLGLIEMTLPDKPRNFAQRYRLTRLGHLWLKDQSNTRSN